MIIDDLRMKIPQEEFDYQTLMTALSAYAHPRKKVTDLLAKGIILRVKKGLYVFGDKFRSRPYSREVLANLIYGPSCVSLEYALHYHGLIPEKPMAVTSVTSKRPKNFQTPVGLFLYKNVPEAGFHIGVQRIEIDTRAFLMAGPEKALIDKFRSDRGLRIRTQKECLGYLVESLRIEQASLRRLDPLLIEKLGTAYHSKRILLLANMMKRLAKRVS